VKISYPAEWFAYPPEFITIWLTEKINIMAHIFLNSFAMLLNKNARFFIKLIALYKDREQKVTV